MLYSQSSVKISRQFQDLYFHSLLPQDRNDNAPVFITMPRPLTLDDDTPLGNKITSLIATDADGTSPGNKVSTPVTLLVELDLTAFTDNECPFSFFLLNRSSWGGFDTLTGYEIYETYVTANEFSKSLEEK